MSATPMPTPDPDTLPELPEPALRALPADTKQWPFPKVGYYTADQMRSFAEAALRAQAEEVERLRNALRIAREGYASEAVTGLPVLPQWRERTMALIDAHLAATKQEKP